MVLKPPQFPGQFTLNFTVSIEPEGESCDPSVLLLFAGIGPGEHPYHQLEVLCAYCGGCVCV